MYNALPLGENTHTVDTKMNQITQYGWSGFVLVLKLGSIANSDPLYMRHMPTNWPIS